MPCSHAADSASRSPRGMLTPATSSSFSMSARVALGDGRVVHVVRHRRPRSTGSGPRRSRRRRRARRGCRPAPRRCCAPGSARHAPPRCRCSTKTEMGRVCGTSASIAPRNTTAVTSCTSIEVDDLGREAAPAARGLGAEQHEDAPRPSAVAGPRRGVEVARARRAAGSGARRACARPSSSCADLRTVELVVDVPLAVELGDRLEREGLDEAAGDAAGGLARVVPALEGDDQQPSRREVGVRSSHPLVLVRSGRRRPGIWIVNDRPIPAPAGRRSPTRVPRRPAPVDSSP